MFENERFEQRTGHGLLFGCGLAPRFELQTQLVVRAALGIIKQQEIRLYAERDGDLL